MSIRIISSTSNMVLEENDDVKIDFSVWNRKYSKGEGGWDLGSIFLRNDGGFIVIRIRTKKNVKKGLVKVIREKLM